MEISLYIPSFKKPLPSLLFEKGFLVQAHLKDISRISLHHKNKCGHSMLTGTFLPHCGVWRHIHSYKEPALLSVHRPVHSLLPFSSDTAEQH